MIRRPLLVLAATLTVACTAGAPAPESAARQETITRTARVQTVDLETRQVLLRMDNDDMLSLVAGPEARNLPQLEPGDVVMFRYYEAVAVRMADSASGEPTGAVVAERAPEGAKPGGGVGASVNMVVEFLACDPVTHVATFRAPDWTVAAANVRPEMRAFAAARKPGDRVDLTITQAVAVSIEERAG